MKTINDLMKSAIETSMNTKSSVFLEFCGDTMHITLYANWNKNMEDEFFFKEINLMDNPIILNTTIAEAIAWIEKNKE